MTAELIALAKQFRISVLYSGKLPAMDEGLSNQDYLLEVLRAEGPSTLDKKMSAAHY